MITEKRKVFFFFSSQFVHPIPPKILHHMSCCFNPAMCPFALPMRDQSQAACTCMGVDPHSYPSPACW